MLIIGGCTVALALFLTSIVGGVWVRDSSATNSNNTKFPIKHFGLWELCTHDGKCKNIDSMFYLDMAPKWLQTVRILVCVAAGIQVIAIGIAILHMYSARIKLINASTQLLVGPFLMMIAMSIFTGYEGPTPMEPLEWGWSYIFGWLGTCIVPVYGFFIIAAIDENE